MVIYLGILFHRFSEFWIKGNEFCASLWCCKLSCHFSILPTAAQPWKWNPTFWQDIALSLFNSISAMFNQFPCLAYSVFPGVSHNCAPPVQDTFYIATRPYGRLGYPWPKGSFDGQDNILLEDILFLLPNQVLSVFSVHGGSTSRVMALWKQKYCTSLP